MSRLGPAIPIIDPIDHQFSPPPRRRSRPPTPPPSRRKASKKVSRRGRASEKTPDPGFSSEADTVPPPPLTADGRVAPQTMAGRQALDLERDVAGMTSRLNTVRRAQDQGVSLNSVLVSDQVNAANNQILNRRRDNLSRIVSPPTSQATIDQAQARLDASGKAQPLPPPTSAQIRANLQRFKDEAHTARERVNFVRAGGSPEAFRRQRMLEAIGQINARAELQRAEASRLQQENASIRQNLSDERRQGRSLSSSAITQINEVLQDFSFLDNSEADLQERNSLIQRLNLLGINAQLLPLDANNQETDDPGALEPGTVYLTREGLMEFNGFELVPAVIQ